MSISKLKSNIWLILLFLVLCSNFILYRTQFGELVMVENMNPVVLGSLVDLLVVAPCLFMLYKKKFTWKMAIGLLATGCLIAKFLIPAEFLQPFKTITWTGIVLEGAILVFELSLIATLVIYLPKIKKAVRKNELPKVFSFPQAVDQYVKKNPIVYAICSEILMFYYAFLSWKKTAPKGITLYKGSSLIAFQIMLIHAVIIETVGVHWLLHIMGLSPIVSIIMIILNIYGVIFIIGDIQALRHNPIYFNNKGVYISQGLMKRIEVPFESIEEIVTDKDALKSKLGKDTIQFIAKDFEEVYPDVILKLKNPLIVSSVMGSQKDYTQVAIKTDSPGEFLEKIQQGLDQI